MSSAGAAHTSSGLGAERRTLIHLPADVTPPELLPQCFYDLISLHHPFFFFAPPPLSVLWVCCVPVVSQSAQPSPVQRLADTCDSRSASKFSSCDADVLGAAEDALQSEPSSERPGSGGGTTRSGTEGS